MKKSYLIFFFVIAILGLVLAYLAYNQKPLDVKDMKPASQITSSELFSHYQENEEAANARYLDKILIVSGNITKIEKNQRGVINLLLQSSDDFFGISCKLKETDLDLSTLPKTGDLVSIKGICTGFLTDVVMIDCYIE